MLKKKKKPRNVTETSGRTKREPIDGHELAEANKHEACDTVDDVIGGDAHENHCDKRVRNLIQNGGLYHFNTTLETCEDLPRCHGKRLLRNTSYTEQRRPEQPTRVGQING